MQILVKRTSREDDFVYHISQSGQVIIRKKVKRIFPAIRASKNVLIGTGTIFNIPGSYPMQIQPASSDLSRIQQDWERVGQSMYDGIIGIIEK